MAKIQQEKELKSKFRELKGIKKITSKFKEELEKFIQENYVPSESQKVALKIVKIIKETEKVILLTVILSPDILDSEGIKKNSEKTQIDLWLAKSSIEFLESREFILIERETLSLLLVLSTACD